MPDWNSAKTMPPVVLLLVLTNTFTLNLTRCHKAPNAQSLAARCLVGFYAESDCIQKISSFVRVGRTLIHAQPETQLHVPRWLCCLASRARHFWTCSQFSRLGRWLLLPCLQRHGIKLLANTRILHSCYHLQRQIKAWLGNWTMYAISEDPKINLGLPIV